MSKTSIVSLLAVAGLAVGIVLQQQLIRQLRQENEALTQQAAQVAPLQAQVAQDAAEASGGAAAREAQVRELARLRADAQQLRQQSNDLNRARQEIQTLNQRAASEAEARASKTETRKSQAAFQAEAQKTLSAMNACINNLRLIDAAKQQWALENKKQVTDTPTWDDLRVYIGRGPNGELPACPDGGVYTIGAVGEKPTCSNPTHVLPQSRPQ